MVALAGPINRVLCRAFASRPVSQRKMRKGPREVKEIPILKTKFSVLGLYSVLVVALAGCSAMPQPPTAPSATTGDGFALGPDNSTLKVTSPAIVAPIDGVTVDSRTPTLVWANSNGHYGDVGLAYTLEVSSPTAVVYTRTVGESPNTGSHKVELELTQGVVYSWRVRAALGNMLGPWSIWADFKATAPPPPAPTPGGPNPNAFRTPDPPSGQRLPLPDMRHIVVQVAAANPADLRNSCQPEGGNWTFMDKLVDTLQAIDLRWGYNGKRGNSNDPSNDIVDFHYGAGPSEGSTQVYIMDTINGHCTSNPSPTWINQTDITISSGTIGRFITRRPGRR